MGLSNMAKYHPRGLVQEELSKLDPSHCLDQDPMGHRNNKTMHLMPCMGKEQDITKEYDHHC